jgi:cell wall-associated NlpC family hydrolase
MVLILSFGGCASRSTAPVDEAGQSATESNPISRKNPVGDTTGARMAEIALGMVGTPYQYGGTNPEGFDCSGLVFYSYDQLGMRVPRTSAEQRRTAMRVDVTQIQKGDLVFFKMLFKTGHVGIFIGDGRFVHAPSSGKQVRVSSLSTGYFASRLHSAGRLHD